MSIGNKTCRHRNRSIGILQHAVGEKWTVEMLGNTIKFDHGYGRDSAVIGHFLRLLAGLDSPDQRRFLRFVTGSPRLPPGGLASLQVTAVC